MGTLISNGKAIESKTYIALGLDETCKRVLGSPRVLFLVCSVLQRSIQRNERVLEQSKRREIVTIFHGSRAPSLSIRQYMERIFKYSSCSASCFVVALIYIDRFLRRTDAHLTSLNVHRLLITSIMVAAKFMDDECYNNTHYAKVGGVSTGEMNRMEMKFLFNLDFRLHVTKEVFDKYCQQLEKQGPREYHINRSDQCLWARRRQATQR